jgi:hypothetical protein
MALALHTKSVCFDIFFGFFFFFTEGRVAHESSMTSSDAVFGVGG